MQNFLVIDFYDFKKLQNEFIKNNLNANIVVICVGTKKYKYDNFGVILGDILKKEKIIVYGSSKREVNGLNFLKVYNYVKNKHKNCKIIIIDVVFCKSKIKPILIYKNQPIIVSALNNKIAIGDAGILFNSFSYYNKDYILIVSKFILNLFREIS